MRTSKRKALPPRLYPDFLALVNDERIAAVEYKGGK
jgi:hypothetical protein